MTIAAESYRLGGVTRVCSWESGWSPKPPHVVRILTLVLIADVADAERRRSCKPDDAGAKPVVGPLRNVPMV
jgi:hypothetical protein